MHVVQMRSIFKVHTIIVIQLGTRSRYFGTDKIRLTNDVRTQIYFIATRYLSGILQCMHLVRFSKFNNAYSLIRWPRRKFHKFVTSFMCTGTRVTVCIFIRVGTRSYIHNM